MATENLVARNIDELEGLLFAEDLAIGDWMDLGSVSATEAEIIEFATLYDPLPLHTDPEVAARSPFGGIIASAIHTQALFGRLASSRFIPRLALVAGKGMETVRFPAPVRPGDVLHGRMEVTDVDLRDGRADVRARATMRTEVATVMSFTSIVVIRRRD